MKTILAAVAILCYATVFSQAGAFDSSFAINGKFLSQSVINVNEVDQVYDVAIQKDGKIILAGYGFSYSSSSSQQFAVLRLNKDGSLDNTFGNGGEAFTNFPANNGFNASNQAFSVALQADGKIVLSGVSFTYGYIDSLNDYNYSDIAVARLNTDGTPDVSFNGTGTKLIDLAALTYDPISTYNTSSDYCFSVAIKSNGKIVLGCSGYNYDNSSTSYADAAIIQLNTDGSFDTSFAGTGIRLLKTPDTGENIDDVKIQKDGKILLSGSTYTNTSLSDDILAIRLKANGSPDSSFGKTGRVAIDLEGGNDFGSSLAVLSSGKIIISATEDSGIDSGENGSSKVALVRLNANGSLDKTFNGTGKSIVTNGNQSYQADVSVQTDGKILQLASWFPSNTSSNGNYEGAENLMVRRYNANGTTDSTFGTYGQSLIDFGTYTDNSQEFGSACALQKDGKLVIAGTNYPANRACAARILTTGRNIGVAAPADRSATAPTGACTVSFNNIDPVLYPDTSLSLVKYRLYTTGQTAPYDSGYGSVSGKPFNIGSTTVVYSSTIDPLQRAVFNVTVTGGTPAGALDFDGIDDRVLINSYLDPINSISSGQYSFEGWIKVRRYNKDGGSVIFGNERNGNAGILVELNENGYVTTYQPNVGYVVSKSKVPLNKWTHIAFAQSSTSLDLYVNGKFVQTLLTAPNLQASTYTNFYLGAYTNDDVSFSRYFNGEMDEVTVWGRAVCKAEIQNDLHCETVAGFGQGLLAHFTFNEGIASCSNHNITDLNGGSVSGVLQNFALNGPTSNWVAGYISGSCAAFTPLAITGYPDSVTVQATNDSCGATVNFSITISSGCSDSVNIVYSQSPGTFFQVGTTYVSATAQDNYGNTETVSFPVIVTENTPPTLVLKDTSIALDQYGNVYVNPYDLISTLSDNCTPNYNIYTYVNGNSYFGCYNLGPNTISITAVDQSGNATTDTAAITILPYAGSATVQAIPNPQQYSDYTTLIATLNGAQNFYYNGCLSASDVTFKVGSKVIGTATLTPDGYGNLYAAISYRLTDIFPKKITAVFNGLNTSVYSLPNTSVSTTLNGAPENATVDYIESQLISTTTSKVTIPVSVQLTDTVDGARGDIRKSVVTFLIQPVTGGATVAGSNTLTVSTLEFVSSDKTSGVARGSFTVNLGRNTSAKFNVIATVSNYYTGTTTAVVYVSKSAGSLIADNDKTSLTEGIKSPIAGDDFGVTVLPNPSKNIFSLQVNSSRVADKVNIRISDAVGRVIETFANVSVGNIVKLGATYQPGIYMAEISQGTNRKSYRLIKL